MAGVDEKKVFLRFVFFTYIVFWLSFAIMGLALFLKVPSAVFTVLKNVSAWTPTFVLLAMYRRLFPGISFREFLARNFRSRMHPSDFLFAFIISFFALAAATAFSCLYSHTSFSDLSFILPAQILPVLLVNLTAGPMGEELGWRSYALGDLKKRHRPLASAVILGFVWGFWHLPLWIISGYTGIELAVYIVLFLVAIVSLSVIIAWFYGKSGNILIAITLHLLFNFSLAVVTTNFLVQFAFVALCYFIVALVLTIAKRQILLRRA